MYIGIKYEVKRKVVNKQLQSFGSAIMPHGQTSYYFNNPVTAIRVRQYLNNKMKNFQYNLQMLSKEEIKEKKLIKSYDDFLEYAEAKKSSQNTTSTTEIDNKEMSE